MHVDEPRHDDEAGRVDHRQGSGREARRDGRDPSVFDPNIEDGIGPRRRVDDASVDDQKFTAAPRIRSFIL
jgi:hypothetical protein